MYKIVTILCILGCLFFIEGCTNTNNQANSIQIITPDGKIDAVEAATIRLAVGAALSAKPETIKPAYAVSTALLATINTLDYAVLVSVVDKAIQNEVNKLNLDNLTKQSFNDLIVLVKAQIKQQINVSIDTSDIISEQRKVLISDILKIVQEASSARL